MKKIISILLALTLSIGALTLVGCSNVDNTPTGDSVATESTLQATNYKVETVSTENIRLMSSAPVMLASSNVITQTLTATVLPETASNKSVDWVVEWGDSSNTSNVSDYITVTPASDGSTTATVTCKQSFTGNILITVTTRENGYSASCIVTYLGKPTDIALSGTISQTSGEYKVGVAQTYTFDVTLSNVFYDVGSQFNNITCGVDGVGSVILGYMEKNNSSGNTNWYDTSDETHTLDSLKDNFITVSYSNGQLTVTTIKSIESYYESTDRLDSGRTTAYNNKFRSYVDDCYFKVWVQENNSGLKEEFIFRFDETVVTGVSVSNTEISF